MRQEHLDDLIAFIEVAESRGFSAAATKMGMSPSAVSQAIRNLEARLGATLFHRTTRSVSLTEAGVTSSASSPPSPRSARPAMSSPTCRRGRRASSS
ncbi:LysR family transcriptional regulator [Sorangium sp. So ce118]